jgi:hypothetical protein
VTSEPDPIIVPVQTNMKNLLLNLSLALALILPLRSPAQSPDTNSPAYLLTRAVTRVAQIFETPTNGAPRTFTARLKVMKADGLPKELVGREASVAVQSPDRLRVAIQWDGQDIVIGRAGQELWVHVPAKKFGLIGLPDVPPFATAPERKGSAKLGPIKLPVSSDQMVVLPFLMRTEALPDERIGGAPCRAFKATPTPEAIEAFKVPAATIQLAVRESDSIPLRIGYREGKTDVQIEVIQPEFAAAWPAERWKLKAGTGDKVESVALSHLTRFLAVAPGMLGEKIPKLGPATGERRVVARDGNGRLEMVDGTRVLFLQGTPEEMGRQHGALMRKEVANLVNHVLYGVGVGSSFDKGRWFFGDIESAQARLEPFMDARYFREMDALAAAAGLPREEVRLANFFPELFHCSGFAVFGQATVGGKMYHGRILDYLRGMGLEQNATVFIVKPDQGNAWVNVGYAGFIGSVTAMNEKHVAIGEMGGRGEGNWDGKPMAELVREVMEKAGTLDEAVAIMRKGPRTCEYYYVITDAKTKRAVGIAATPDKFEVVEPGRSHPLLPHGIPDAVLMSAGDRYEELARRVKGNYGKLDAQGARDLMSRPVCMTSNIHSVLFDPETLDFWVANADSENPASHTRYTRYNLGELLQPEKTQ